jgi:hypothetical protein
MAFFEGLGTAAGLLGAGTAAVDIAGGVQGLFSNPSAPSAGIRKPFKKPLSTDVFSFGGGQLSRRSDFVPQEETRLRGLIGENRLGVSALRDDLARTGRFVGDLAGLQEQVTPGFGRLTESLVQSNRDAEARERGNLRESLRERRVLGSSFANAAETSLGLDFAREEERIRAESFVAELDLSRQLISDQAVLELNLNTADASLLNQQLAAIQTDAALLQTQINRELSELDIATEFLAVVNQQSLDSVADDMERAADNFVPGNDNTADAGSGGGAGSDTGAGPNAPSGPGPGAGPPERRAIGATIFPQSSFSGLSGSGFGNLLR